MWAVTTLINFSVSLTDTGDIQTDIEFVDHELFKRVMDEWNPEYGNTTLITYMIRNVVRDLFGVDRLIRSYLR